MKLDVLVIAAHPDDAELNAGGTIASLVAEGKKLGSWTLLVVRWAHVEPRKRAKLR